VLHEVRRNAVEAFVSRDDLVVLAEQLVQQRLLVRVEVGLVDPRCHALVKVRLRHTKLLAAVLIDQLDGRAVLFRALEVVPRHVVAEDAPGELVLLEQGRAGETDERRVGQGHAHVARQPASTVRT
jgi:hypothetical protein